MSLCPRALLGSPPAHPSAAQSLSTAHNKYFSIEANLFVLDCFIIIILCTRATSVYRTIHVACWSVFCHSVLAIGASIVSKVAVAAITLPLSLHAAWTRAPVCSIMFVNRFNLILPQAQLIIFRLVCLYFACVHNCPSMRSWLKLQITMIIIVAWYII